jgi:superfamily II DNA or RNA helicase
MLKITIDNVIYSHINKQDIAILEECLQYKYQKHKFNPYAHKNKSSYEDKIESLIDKDGKFFTGYIARVKKYLSGKNIPYEIENNSERLKPDNEPIIKDKTLREDQKRNVDAAIKNQRGIVISPTGTGKTLIAGSIISCFKNKKTLFLVHTKSLLKQAADDFKEYGLKNITMIGDAQKDLSGDIVISTRQSFVKLDFDEIADLFDIVIVDEIHHLTEPKMQYTEILSKLLAPIRIGLTATFPSKIESQMVIEAYLGEVVGEFTEEEAREKDIIADTKVIIRKTSFDSDVADLSAYKRVYNLGVVNNQSYNLQIIKEAKYWIEQNKSVLIFIIETDQGRLLQKFAKENNVECEFVYGDTKSDSREKVKADLKTKKLKCVICSKIWAEGINIPALEVIINAAGGKSETMLRQLRGRGVRTYKGKDRLILIDFFNPSHSSLIKHFGFRISMYCDYGWM